MSKQQESSKQDVRRWALEQAIRLHGQNGVTTEKAIGEARLLLGFLDEADAPTDKPAKPDTRDT